MSEADFVIIGSGSAGSALAYRLAEDGRHSVLVLEYGGTDIGPFIQMPAALSYPMNMRRYDWGFWTEPEPGLGGRRLPCPRGKVIGGSSSVNGMVYVRGHAHDYDHWAEEGADGWAYADVLPYFKRMENWHDGGHGGDPDWRGKSGPLYVTRGPRKNPLYHAFVEAGAQAGYQRTDDYNGEKQEGFGPMEQTVWQGRRWSAANAYLRPALKRANMGLMRCFARRIVIEDGRAVGVEIRRAGRVETVRARREVIVAASSINSPKLLMLSGIGPAAHLAEHGIEVVADRPGVGQNLQDHLELYIQQACTQPITLYRHWSLFRKALAGAEWMFFKTGFGASNQFESAAFVRSHAGVAYPDIQFHFLPFAVRYDGHAAAEGHGYQAHVGPMRSASRGEVTLRSADPDEKPRIAFRYMSARAGLDRFPPLHPHHAGDFRAARIRRLSRQGDPAGRGSRRPTTNSTPSSASTPKAPTILAAPAGWAGRDDPMAVVDPQCRVIGVEALRVADSSIFPRITNGNLNAPSIMVGEKAADHMLGRQPLARENAEPWINPNWRVSDR